MCFDNDGMQVLEVRFHPRGKRNTEQVVVARVICLGRDARIDMERIQSRLVAPFDPAGLEAKLRYLVSMAEPHYRENLTRLPSEFWSFVDVSAAVERMPAADAR